jgi:hypothetical protein
MRWSALFLLLVARPLLAQSSDEKEAIAAVQKLFDGMAAHDAATIRSVTLPEARLYAVRDEGAPSNTGIGDFITRLTALKGDLLERFTARPTVSLRGPMAQVWGEYEFLRDGKFSHCGVDSVSLFKTAEGWKVAAIAYTAETHGCNGH